MHQDFNDLGVPVVAQHLRTWHSVHEDAGSIPGFTQWVKILVLPRAVVQSLAHPYLAWELPYATDVAVKRKSKKINDPYLILGELVTCILYFFDFFFHILLMIIYLYHFRR